MIKILLSATLLFAAIVPSVATLATIEDEAHAATWAAYCATYGVNPDEPTDEEINYFLDCWRGSTEEETALTPEQNNAIN